MSIVHISAGNDTISFVLFITYLECAYILQMNTNILPPPRLITHNGPILRWLHGNFSTDSVLRDCYSVINLWQMLAEMDSEWTTSPGKDFRQRLQMFVEERMQTTMVLALVALNTCRPIFYV